ncbi:unnamed protein product, partial [Ixodes pacificus]
MTAFSRLASFSDALSSVSSLLGKVMRRVNVDASYSGRALKQMKKAALRKSVVGLASTYLEPSDSRIWIVVLGWDSSTGIACCAVCSAFCWTLAEGRTTFGVTLQTR